MKLNLIVASIVAYTQAANLKQIATNLDCACTATGGVGSGQILGAIQGGAGTAYGPGGAVYGPGAVGPGTTYGPGAGASCATGPGAYQGIGSGQIIGAIQQGAGSGAYGVGSGALLQGAGSGALNQGAGSGAYGVGSGALLQGAGSGPYGVGSGALIQGAGFTTGPGAITSVTLPGPGSDLSLGGVSCPSPSCGCCQSGSADLNCVCHLPLKELGAGVATSYNSGSTAIQTVGNTEVPDKLYVTDNITCNDKSEAGNKKGSSTEIGTRTFTIAGNIEVNERFDEATAGCREERSRANECGHTEQRTELITNVPAPGQVPCACN